MTCEKFAEMLDNYESLTDEEKALMAEHAALCESCGRELNFMMSVINAVKTLPELKVPDDFLENLNRRIDAEEAAPVMVTKTGILGHIRYNWQKYSAAAACLVLAAVIGANYNTLIDNMNGGDDGVISTVTTVSSPVPDNGDTLALTAVTAAPVATTAATADKTTDNKPKEANVSVRTRSTSTVTNGKSGFAITDAPVTRSTSAPETKQTSTIAPVPTAITEAVKIPETAAPTVDAGTEKLTLTRGIYVESRKARGIMLEDVDDAVEDNPYEISAMSETGEYAVAMADELEEEHYGGSCDISSYSDEDNSLGYQLNPSNMVIVKGEDFATAFDIISRYASDSYNSYFVITEEDFYSMLSALHKAGVQYSENVEVGPDKITFRISIG